MPSAGRCLEAMARVDKTEISPEDAVYLEVEIRGGKAEPDLSMIRDFKVMPRGTASSYQWINGRAETRFTHQYLLVPLTRGELTIPAIKVSLDGETASTKEIVIRVAEEKKGTEKAGALFAEADISRPRLYLGEAAVYSLKFFTSRRLAGLGFETPPDFKGISGKPFDKEKTYTRQINGVVYQVTQVDYLLEPSSAGTYTLDPVVFAADVLVQSGPDPRFGSFLNPSFFSSGMSRPIRVTANPVSLDVRPLPEYSGPHPFSGLVGRFSLDARMDRTEMKKGESATLTIILSGSGNLMDAPPPVVDVDPEAFKTYDDNPVETITPTGQGYEGEKVFKKALVPVRSGRFAISPGTLVYFDVDQGAYKTISAPRIHLDVAPSVETRVAASMENKDSKPASTQQEVELIHSDILDIREGADLLVPKGDIRFLTFALLMMAPGILFVGVRLGSFAWKKDISFQKVMRAKARLYLKQAGQMKARDQGDYLGPLYTALVSAILSRSDKKGETLTLTEAGSILSKIGMDGEEIRKTTELLEQIESARFSGKGLDEGQGGTIFADVKKMIKHLCMVVLCLGGIAFMPHPAAADESSSTLAQAIRLYKAGNFGEAARAFESLALIPIRNPDLYYNTGNAFLKAGDLGRAILWYERAGTIAPGDPDLLFNLDYARSRIKDSREDSPDMTDLLFFLTRVFPFRILQISAIAVSFVFFTWASLRTLKGRSVFSGFGLFLCVLLVISALMASAGYVRKIANVHAVVVKEEISVRSGMSETATHLFSLHAGTRVRVVERRDDFLKIRFVEDRIGWVRSDDASLIDP